MSRVPGDRTEEKRLSGLANTRPEQVRSRGPAFLPASGQDRQEQNQHPKAAAKEIDGDCPGFWAGNPVHLRDLTAVLELTVGEDRLQPAIRLSMMGQFNT